MRKSLFISFIITLIGLGLAVWLFFSTAILEFTDDMGITHTQTKQEIIVVSSGKISENTGSSWSPDQIRTETIENSSGMTITVSTNGPSVQQVTKEEQEAFLKQIQRK